jgi:hypothetical protein
MACAIRKFAHFLREVVLKSAPPQQPKQGDIFEDTTKTKT